MTRPVNAPGDFIGDDVGIRKCIFFTAGQQLSTLENELYEATFAQNFLGWHVSIQDKAFDSGLVQACDAVMSYTPVTTLPTQYASAITAGTILDLSAALCGAGFGSEILAPGTGGVFAHTGSYQLCLVITDANGDIFDQTESGVVWTSTTPATATINASTGKVTGVAAGTTTFRATRTLQGGRTDVQSLGPITFT